MKLNAAKEKPDFVFNLVESIINKENSAILCLPF